MKNNYYKPITRSYYDDNDEIQTGRFIARGQWADGHLSYSRLDENDEPIDDEDCCYIQRRYTNGGLYMERI